LPSLKQVLITKLRGKIPDDLLRYIPSRYPIIGSAVLIHLHPALNSFSDLIGNAILEALGNNVKSVWVKKGKTLGIYRKPMFQCIVGECNPIVIHRELNTLFKLDISKLTFSPGNAGERERLVRMIRRDDVILDMFACCGNLSMPIAVNVKPKCIYAVEINPLAYAFLLENIRLNKVSNIVQPSLMDNHYLELEEIATHVLLGFLPSPDKIQTIRGIKAICPEGGVLHYHTIVRNKYEYSSIITNLLRLVNKQGYRVEKVNVQKIKNMAPKVEHIVIRLNIKR